MEDQERFAFGDPARECDCGGRPRGGAAVLDRNSILAALKALDGDRTLRGLLVRILERVL